MKKFRCAATVLLGIVLGLLSACTAKSRSAPETPRNKTTPTGEVAQPSRTNSLPTRVPVME